MSLNSLIRPRPMPYGGQPISDASPRTVLQESGAEFSTRLRDLTQGSQNNQRVAVRAADGKIELLTDKARPSAGFRVLPLASESLQKALDTIQDRDPWLMDGSPIFKTERNGNARIDFLNRGGYVFDQQGESISRSVNGW